MPLTVRMGSAGPAAGQDDEPTQLVAREPAAPRARRCPTCSQAFSGHARFCPFDGDPLLDAPDYDPATDALIGQVIDGRYKVASVLGEGGMGTVYEVRHVTLDRRFALKVLRRDVAQDKELTARFIQEAKAAASIGHPNIVAVSDFGELDLDPEGGRGRVPYFVMEHLTGLTLAELLRADKTLEPRRAARILLQCASALEAAHAAGVLHRDLKPDNVFLTESAGREFVKVLDFGVAKMAGAGKLTRAGMVFGTPHYMSPEQAAGEPVDRRGDIYALGVILYECFAGKVPFEADTYMGVLTKHMFAQPTPIEWAAPDPRALGALGPIAMRCLAKKPDDRYATMAEVAQAIELALGDPEAAAAAALGSVPPSSLRLREPNAPPPARDTPPPLPLSPSPLRIAAVLGGVLALAVLGAVAWRALSGPASARSEAGASLAAAAGASAAPATAAPVAPTPSAADTAPVTPTPASSTAAPGPPTAIAATAAPAAPRGAPPKQARPPAKHGGAKSGELVDPWAH